MKHLLLLISVFFCLHIANETYTITKKEVATNDTILGTPHAVTVTMYLPVVSQCDETPLITADGSHINPKHASEQKLIAVSRDLLKHFKYGDLVLIKGTGKKDGIYRIADTMNKRIKKTIDILETAGTPLYKFKNVTLTKIEWKTQTPTENLLATL